MNKYLVKIEGRNVFINIETKRTGVAVLLGIRKEVRKVGFFATRVVDAMNADDAERLALKTIKDEIVLLGAIENTETGSPIFLVSGTRILDLISPSLEIKGFTFYMDDQSH